MEFIIFLSKLDKEILNLLIKANYIVEENKIECQINKDIKGLHNFEKNKIKNKQSFNQINPKKNLWFVNIGGYDPSSMQEKHEFGLVVASSSLEAKNKAKSKWLKGCRKKHKDDIASLNTLISCDDCQLIKNIGSWEIELILENNLPEETNFPDWYGYKRIDDM